MVKPAMPDLIQSVPVQHGSATDTSLPVDKLNFLLVLLSYSEAYSPSNRQCLSYDDCLEVRRENDQNCSVLYRVQELCTVIHAHTCEQFLNLRVGLGFKISFLCVCLGLAFCVFMFV